LPAYLPHGWAPASDINLDREYVISHHREGGEPVYEIRCGDHQNADFRGALDRALDALEKDIRLFLVDHARDWIFVHAGVVGWRGKAIVLPAQSKEGKSTLTLELVRAGAIYYSDEFAVLDLSGRVHPFATPLQLRSRPGEPQQRRDPSEVGGQVGTEPIPVGIIAAVKYRPGSEERLEDLTAGRGVLALLEHVPIGPDPEITLEVLQRAVTDARVVAGERGEARGFAEYLLGLMDERVQTV
jgi:hypothetical protein